MLRAVLPGNAGHERNPTVRYFVRHWVRILELEVDEFDPTHDAEEQDVIAKSDTGHGGKPGHRNECGEPFRPMGDVVIHDEEDA